MISYNYTYVKSEIDISVAATLYNKIQVKALYTCDYEAFW